MGEDLEKWKKEVDENLKKHSKTLYGNGEPGMDEEIRNIKSMLGVLIKLAWIVTGAVVSVSVVGIAGVIVYLARVMPH